VRLLRPEIYPEKHAILHKEGPGRLLVEGTEDVEILRAWFNKLSTKLNAALSSGNLAIDTALAGEVVVSKKITSLPHRSAPPLSRRSC
jgi:hypothetical protein